MIYNPLNDGIDHINIYSKGQTELGKALSNFGYSRVFLPDGEFNSLEGYYYWLRSEPGREREELRRLTGWKAKELGKTLERNNVIDYKDFILKFLEAMMEKAKQHDEIFYPLINSELPLAHYYVYGGKVVDAKFEWMVKGWEDIREILRVFNVSNPKIPCIYNIAWQGQCERRSVKDGFCAEHLGKKCNCRVRPYNYDTWTPTTDLGCGKQAIADCSNMSSFVCGTPYCKDCGRHTNCTSR